MDSERYLYEVRPRKPVRIPGQRATMTRRTILLTKEEVKEYMKNGPVYRRSAKGELVQVTGATLEKLHAPFDGEKVAQSSNVIATHDHNDDRFRKQSNSSYQNESQKWDNSKKDKKHGKDRNNYHGDDRGKAVTNDSDVSPQYREGNTPTQVSAAPVVNLP